MVTSGRADRLRGVRIESNRKVQCLRRIDLSLLSHGTRKVHVSLFYGSLLPVVRIDSARIESNRKVPQTNRLSLDVLDMDGA